MTDTSHLPDPAEVAAAQQAATGVSDEEAKVLRGLEKTHEDGANAMDRFGNLMGEGAIELSDDPGDPDAPESDTPEGDTNTPADKAEDAETAPDPDVDADELAKALESVRRDKVPTSVIDKMTPQEIIEHGKAVSKIRADNDAHVQKLTEELNAKAASPVSEESSAQTAEPADHPAETSELATALVEKHGFGEDEASAIVSTAQQIAESAIAPKLADLEKQLGDAQEKLSNALGLGGAALMDGARHRLGERVPKLSDDKVFSEQVKPALDKLNPELYENADDLMLDAVRLSGLRVYASRDEATSEKTRAASDKDNGQPTSRSKATRHAPTQDEKDDAVLRQLESKHGQPA